MTTRRNDGDGGPPLAMCGDPAPTCWAGFAGTATSTLTAPSRAEGHLRGVDHAKTGLNAKDAGCTERVDADCGCCCRSHVPRDHDAAGWMYSRRRVERERRVTWVSDVAKPQHLHLRPTTDDRHTSCTLGAAGCGTLVDGTGVRVGVYGGREGLGVEPAGWNSKSD
jgi:hypothetical protein